MVLSLLLVDVSPIVNSKDEPSFRSQEKDSIGLDFQKKGGDPLVCLVQKEINFPIHSIKHEKGKGYPMP